jgi:putative peptidoglycan lipid II flippase
MRTDDAPGSAAPNSRTRCRTDAHGLRRFRPIDRVRMTQSASGQTSSEGRSVARAAGVVGFWTVLSRILGFVRDMTTALFLGAGPGADAFFVAFRIPNLLRRLFAEGALSAAFIPVFVETLHKHGKSEAEKLARVTMTFAASVLIAVTVAGILASPWIVRLIAPGFAGEAVKFDLTVSLNEIMFPYILFISLTALASGVLNSLGFFGAPAAAPILLNVSMIFSLTLCARALRIEPYYALAWGVLVAGVLQLLLQAPFLRIAGIGLRPDFRFRNPILRRVGALFLPAAFGGAVYQINVLLGTVLASMLPSGSVSWLYYADRVVELPLGVFAIALGTAALPSMSRLAAKEDLDGLRNSLSYSLRLIALFTLPASAGLIVLGEPIIALLFQRGLFHAEDTQRTAYALTCYALGLWAFSALKVVTQVFFALKDTKTPVRVSCVAVAVNVGVGAALMGPLGHGGLALATSVSAAFNVAALFRLLGPRLGGFPAPGLGDSLARIAGASLIMTAPLLWIRSLGDWGRGLTPTNLALLAAAVIGGMVVFFGAAYALKCRELRALSNAIRRSPGSRNPR